MQAQSVAGPSTELAAGETPRRRKYFISSDSDSEDTIFGSSKNGARAPSSNSAAITQTRASQLQVVSTPLSSALPPTATGLFFNSGLSLISNEAKKLSIST